MQARENCFKRIIVKRASYFGWRCKNGWVINQKSNSTFFCDAWRRSTMIGLDINVFVRYIVRDNAKQSPQATNRIRSFTADAPGHISIVSAVELVCIVSGCYVSTKEEMCEVLATLLRTKKVIVAHGDTVPKGVRLSKEDKAA